MFYSPLLLLVGVYFVYGQTVLEPTISTTKQLISSESPYVANTDITVTESGHLEIQPGVRILFDPGTGLDVFGTITSSGTEDNPVEFNSVVENFNFTEHINETEVEARLVGGNRYDTGILELYTGGTWTQACDYRMSRLQGYASWMKSYAKVVCRQMGFVDFDKAELQYHETLNNYNQYRPMYSCFGNESKLQGCLWSNSYCNSRYYTVSVKCNSVFPGEHWGGICFMNGSTASKSVLNTTFIYKAGVRMNSTINRLSPALSVYDDMPKTSNLHIAQSAYHGLQIEQVNNEIRVDGVTVRDSWHDGIVFVGTNQKSVMFSNLYSYDNGRHGMAISGTGIEHTDYFDFCEVICLRCEYTPSQYPLYFQTSYNGQSECGAAFSTSSDEVLLLRVLEGTENIYLTIRDGDLIDSPIIWNSELHSSRWNFPTYPIITRTNTININIRHLYSWNRDTMKFMIISGRKENFGMWLSDTSSYNNGEDGILVQRWQMPIYISNINSMNNNNGLHVKASSTKFFLLNSKCVKNNDSGLKLENSDGEYVIEYSTLDNNTYGILDLNTLYCPHIKVATRLSEAITLNNVNIRENSDTGLNVQTTCRGNYSIVGSDLSKNQLALKIIYSGSYDVPPSFIEILFNSIMNNQFGIHLQVYGYFDIIVKENIFKYNQGPVFYQRISNNDRSVNLNMSQNIFSNNTILENSLVTITNVQTSNTDVTYDITDNTFENNYVASEIPYFRYALQDIGAVVHLKVSVNVNLKYNIFHNPLSQLDLAITDTSTTRYIDASYCYWGANNVNFNWNRMFSYYDYNVLHQLRVAPYLRSEDKSDINNAPLRYQDFQTGSVIGGVVVGNHVISDSIKSYIVIKHIVIPKGASLTIQPGVELRFLWGIGMEVYGKLRIEGQEYGHVNLTANQEPRTNFVKLENGTNSRNGIPFVTEDEQYLPVCYSNINTNTLHFLCRAAGFEEYIKTASTSNLVVNHTSVISAILCTGTKLRDCSISYAQDCPTFLVLECRENYWSGIYLSLHAEQSTLNFVNIAFSSSTINSKRTKAAIDIDYNQHLITNININNIYPNSNARGIVIAKSNFTSWFENISIDIGYGIGVYSYDNRLKMKYVKISGLNVNNDHGIYIYPQMTAFSRMNSVEIKHICHFDLNTYNLSTDETLFIHVHDNERMFGNLLCEFYITVPEGQHVLVQQLTRSGSRSCHGLKLYDGHTNDTQMLDIPWAVEGDYWISSDNSLHLIKQPTYYYSCIDTILMVHSTSLTNEQASSLEVNSTLENAYVRNFKNTGIYVHSGTLQLKNSTLQNNQYGLQIRSDRDIVIEILNGGFNNNFMAVYLQPYYTNSWKLHVQSCEFLYNSKVFEIASPNSNDGRGLLTFLNNTVQYNNEGIIFSATHFSKDFYWVINKNIFSENQGRVLLLSGSGHIVSNIIRNNSSPRDPLIEMDSYGSEFLFMKNKFIENTGVYILIYGKLFTGNIIVQSNEIIDNNVVNSVWLTFLGNSAAVKDNLFHFNNNTFKGNSKSTDQYNRTACSMAAINFPGVRKIKGHFNIFMNPDFTFEMQINLLSFNRSSLVDFSDNYWASTDPNIILSRIKYGRFNVNNLQVVVSPFYTKMDLIENKSDLPDPFSLQGGTNTISGRISQSIEFKENQMYSISGDLLIETDVTLKVNEGSNIKIKPGAKIYIVGSLLVHGTTSNPVKIATDYLSVMESGGCQNLQLSGGIGPHEGRIDVFLNSEYYSVCHQDWTMENTRVACRSLGYESSESKGSYANSWIGKLSPVRFRCSGFEDSLFECPQDFQISNCYYRYTTNITCVEKSNRKASLIFEAAASQQPSSLQNVIFANISKLVVTHEPPAVENVTLTDTDHGIIYVGSGMANEKDVVVKNVKIETSKGNGLSFYNITSNVTIEHASISDLGGNGISLIPTDRGDMYANEATSSFHFCDAETELIILPGQEYRYFGKETNYEWSGCARMFSTVEDYVISFDVKAASTSLSISSVLQVYDGSEKESSRLLATYSVNINSANSLKIKSLSNAMTVQALLTGDSSVKIKFAAVSSIKKRANDCNFEYGLCSWHNYDDKFTDARGQWFNYNCSSLLYNTFNGMEKDVNFQHSTDGHYMVAGNDQGTGCSYHSSGSYKSQEAIFESPPLDGNGNICSVSLSHYRYFFNPNRDERLTVYIDKDERVERLWYSSSLTIPNRSWRRVTIPLYLQQRNETTTLIIHAEYPLGCINSVGVDDIVFNPCPEAMFGIDHCEGLPNETCPFQRTGKAVLLCKEKFVSTIRITESAIEQVTLRPIWIWNSDPEKHNIIWIERVSVHDSGSNASIEASMMELQLKSAYVLVRNTDMKNCRRQYLSITFHSQTFNRISEASVTQNSFLYGTGYGMIRIKNNGVNNAAFWIISNTIMHSTGTAKDIVVHIVNASTQIEDNFVYNNTAGHIMQLGELGIITILQQHCTGNTFWFNRPIAISKKYTVNMYSPVVEFHNNLLNNPSATYEVSTFEKYNSPSSNFTYSINCTSNWWGSGESSVALSKIRDGRATTGFVTIDLQPILARPSESFGLTTSCALGWQRVGSYCYFYNVGAVTLNQAIKTCLQLGSQLTYGDTADVTYITKVTKYRDVDGTTKYASVWLNSATNEIDTPTLCRTRKVTGESMKVIFAKQCDELHPFICQRFSIVLCKNACFQRGLCLSKTCLCNEGWENDDCSTFHCKNVNDCSGNGKCVGPNQCKCDDGWIGRTCSSSYCPRYSNCKLCSAKRGCGWCDSTEKCLPGTGFEPSTVNCTNWFYYKCMTVEGSTSCSDQISTLLCSSRYCSSTNTANYDPGLCQQCTDVENCYTMNSKCKTWNETICPNGVVKPNYDDTSRAKKTVFRENVRVIDPATTLMFYCPYKLSSSVNDNRNLFITQDTFSPAVGHVMVSAQSDGILHKIEHINHKEEGITYVVGAQAGLPDIIKYADFNKHVPMKELMHPLTVEEEIDIDLMSQFFSGEINITDDVHIFEESADIFKCAGHVYEENGNSFGDTYYAVIAKDSVFPVVKEGDIIVANVTDGYFETITYTTATSSGFFARSNLTHCAPDNLQDLNIDYALKPAMSCYGGDGWPGLHYYTVSHSNLVGRTVPGRKSGPVLGKVVTVVEHSNFMYFELSPVEYVENGTAVSSSDPTDLTITRRKYKRSVSNFFKKITKNPSIDIGSGDRILVKSTIKFYSDLDVQIKARWNFQKRRIDWNIGAAFGGSVTIVCSVTCKISRDVPALSGSPVKLFDFNFPRFYILVGSVPIAGKSRLEGQFNWQVSASVFLKDEICITVVGSGKAGFKTGFATSGLPKPPRKVSSVLNTWYIDSQHVKDVDISFQSSITPQFVATWPSINGNWKIDEGDIIPGSLSLFSDNVYEQVGFDSEVKFFLEATFGTQFILNFFANGCDTACTDPLKPLRLGIKYGLSELFVQLAGFGLSAKIRGDHKNLRIGKKSDCFAQTGFDCCICEDTKKPGKCDAENKKCLCECCCDPKGGTVDASCKKKSTEDHTGQCQCEKCSDDSLKHWSADIKCPCKCDDGKEREMEADGSCDCSCPCLDGSKDVINSNGECPCKCTCKNCDESTLGADGCICPDNMCPGCEDGSEAQWINCECRCPEPECGLPPVCVTGMRGMNCDQPDCPNCQGCSGNGRCVTRSGSCSSSCLCFRRWRGSCCEEREPNIIWGDPHLETLDGFGFDYFGIGQFWDCKSEANDFGYQVRFFYYGQTSFTGAVALKAVDSVITITTPAANVADQPSVRLNGNLLPLDKRTTQTLHSEIKMTIEPKSGTLMGTDTGVFLASFQYKTGASLTVDVQFSPKMQRHYLNVAFTPTAMFKHNTSGLCGYMDDTQSNDLRGPDGTIYQTNNTDAFVETWKIEPMSRTDGGMLGSWSWTETNFHINDTIDNSYNDPSFTPSYSITGFTLAQIDQATNTCAAKGVSGNLLDGCIYDVVITGDETMANQETLQIGCPGQCSSKGSCLNNTCTCIDGWSGDDCSIGSCSTCFQGSCQAGFCQCNVGWVGALCNETATCYNVNNCSGASQGVCAEIDKCNCIDGFTGSDCSVVATCFNVKNCSGNGVCTGINVCRCKIGYNGTSCSSFTCESLGFCSSHGQCIGINTCLCSLGWTGSSCSTADCSKVNSCSGNGECTAPQTCLCISGYTGTDCSTLKSCLSVQDCNKHGVCGTQSVEVNGVPETTYTEVCSCDTGYSGKTCSAVSCTARNDCSGQGTCTAPDYCTCIKGYGGNDCQAFTCENLNRCSAHGTCEVFDICNCTTGWFGNECETPDCSSVNDCSSQGNCISPGNCDCFDGYEGVDCSTKASPNMFDPMFEQRSYAVTVKENEAVPKDLLQVNASDSDVGTTGDVRYSIDPSGSVIYLPDYLIIDSVSGKIQLVKAIPRNLFASGVLNLTLVATDRGSPARKKTSQLIVNIVDVNECPAISYPTVKTVIYLNESSILGTLILNIQASDPDFGINKQLSYEVDQVVNQIASANVTSGSITLGVSNPAVQDYQVTIKVKDQSTTPCTVQVTFTLHIVPQGISIPEQLVPAQTTESIIETTEQNIQTTEHVKIVEPTTTESVNVQYTTQRELQKLTSADTTTMTIKVPDITSKGPAVNGQSATSIPINPQTTSIHVNSQSSTTSKGDIQRISTVIPQVDLTLQPDNKVTPVTDAVKLPKTIPVSQTLQDTTIEPITKTQIIATTGTKPTEQHDISTVPDVASTHQETSQSSIKSTTGAINPGGTPSNYGSLIALGTVLSLFTVAAVTIIAVLSVKYVQAQRIKADGENGGRIPIQGGNANGVPGRAWRWLPWYY